MGTIHGSGGCPLLATTARTAVAIGAATLGLIAALAGASRADAAVTCSYDDVFKLVTIELGANGDIASVHAGGGGIHVQFGAVPCPGSGGPPTVTNTNLVVITDNSDNPATPAPADGNTKVEIRDPAGFAPGATQEQGGPAFSEIEFKVFPGGGVNDEIELFDSRPANSDAWVLGTDGINWNPGAGDPTPDAELALAAFDVVVVDLGPGDDSAAARGGLGTGGPFDGPGRLIMRGDAGNDVLLGGDGDDTLHGGDGDDTLEGVAGADRLNGEAGDDSLFGGAGADIADFFGAPAGATVDLSRIERQDTGDGNDRLADFEGLVGSNEGDTLTGDAGENHMLGLEGDDTIDGGTGADTLTGGAGVDTVTYAQAPAGVTAKLGAAIGDLDFLADFENLVGSRFADDLSGDDGPNTITGLGGVDKISALGGPDTVNARDGGPDTLRCGSQDDDALADRRSVEGSIDGDCETVDFLPEPAITDTPPSGVPPGNAAVPDTGISVVLRGARSQRVLKQKGVIVKVRCPLEDCTARARGTGRIPRLQRARGPRRLALKALTRSILGGETRTLKLRLAKRQLRTLRTVLAARKRPKLSVTVRVTDAFGNAAIRSLTVKATP
jgi:Ca2+-binding RTX toxin-like protein